MPLYIADYLSATEHLDAAESGAYLHLIMHYWQKGKLPTEDRFLARIARMTERQWAKAKPTIQAFFDENWCHSRIESELEKASDKSEKRSEAGSRGGHAKALKNNDAPLANATDLLGDLPEQNAGKNIANGLASSSDSTSQDKISRDKSLSPISVEKLAVEFYQAYPKRVDPVEAKKRFAKAVKSGVDPQHIIAAAKRFAEAHRRAGTPKNFIPAPAVWLNKGSYDSEDLPVPDGRSTGPPSRELWGSV